MSARYIELDKDWRLCVFCDWRELEPTGKSGPGRGTWHCTGCGRIYGDRVIGSDTDRQARKRRERERAERQTAA